MIADLVRNLGTESPKLKMLCASAMYVLITCFHEFWIFIFVIVFSKFFFSIKNNIYIMAVPVVEFLREGYKIRKCFGSKLTVVKWNDWILRIGVMSRCQKGPKFDFKSQFSISKIIGIFLIFFIEEYEFRSTFFVINIFS